MPESDEARCTDNTDDLHGFGVFSYDTRENAVHYDFYAPKYDGMQDMSGFNDPYEMTKATIERLGQPG